MLGLDVLVNVANVVYLASYSVRDILWLRCLTIVGGTLLLPYYYWQVHPLWAAIGWNLVFISINIFWVVKLLIERRPVQFSEEERRLHRDALPHVSDKDARRLFDKGTWTTAPAGTSLLTQGRPVGYLSLLSTGEVSVLHDGTRVDTLGGGRFLGATSYLRQGMGFVAPVAVDTTETTRLISWSFEDLAKLVSGNTDFKADLEAEIGLELSRYLQAARAQIPHLHVS